MRIADVAVATMTLVRDEGDDELLREALRRLAGSGTPVFVADGGSPAGFTAAIAALPGLTLVPPDARGLVGQVRASLRAAAAHGAPFVLYTEPDKARFFDRNLHAFIDAAPDTAGVVLAARSPAAFATFPRVQQRTEAMVNDLAADVTGVPADYCYGPFLVRRELVAETDRVPADIGWGWRPFLFVTTHRLGFPVSHVEGAFECPPEQRVEDEAERVHRLRQLGQNVAGLALALSS